MRIIIEGIGYVVSLSRSRFYILLFSLNIIITLTVLREFSFNSFKSQTYNMSMSVLQMIAIESKIISYLPYSFEYNVRIVFFFLRKIANINRMRTLIECEYYYFFHFLD